MPPASGRAITGTGLLVLVLLFGVLTVAAWYISPLVRATDLRARAQALASDAGALGIGDIDSATMAGMRTRLDAIHGDIGWFRMFLASDPLLWVVRAVGPGRDFTADATHVLNAADSLSVAAYEALDIGDELATVRERPGATGESMPGDLVGLVARSTTRVDHAADLLGAAQQEVFAVSPGAQSDVRLAAELMASSIDRYGPLLAQLRAVDDVLPAIVGWASPKRYLVLAQDPAELRPTGGYVGTVGIVSFTDGSMTERNFEDVFHFDLRPGVPFVEPPEPLANHLLGAASWQLADSNWSPDFPTAARDALRLYELESGDTTIDGVLALTTGAVDRLLELTGPVDVPEYDVRVGAGEVTMTALRLTRGASTPETDRKAFLDDLATAVMERLYALPADSWGGVFDAFRDLGERRLLLAWFKDPAAQTLVALAPIGGAVQQESGDYLYVVEANLAPTSKYNLVVDRTDRLAVQLAADGSASSALIMSWQNRSLEPGEPFTSIREYSTSKHGLYGTYTRVLAPANASLVNVSGHAFDPIDAAESIATEAGRASFENYLLIGPNGANLGYGWQTPSVATLADGVWTYSLYVQRQPGLRPHSFAVALTLPIGAQVVSVPQGSGTVDGAMTLAATLDRDLRFEVRYTLP
ncbi:MAG: DUF4012 domain-containing protein [Candidatus Limnocylindrales bacterium]